ncbi:trans-aconitate methyltransferase 1 [Basidiobolus ranarum]|uniref:Trans-aconitate methyltransferase 1 n=1 Tax=Basidiobolus ranarum TaxID=34480 RepID=A0ABR2VSK9_9FUNG
MTTFSNSDYNSDNYRKFRPNYQQDLYQLVYKQHTENGANFDVALDVGTGTGQVAESLAARFQKVYGIDSSSTMLDSAIKGNNIIYSVGSAEDLSQFGSQSIDLISVAEAFHWFNHSKFFDEVQRVLKPQGTLVIIGYSFLLLEGQQEATEKTKKLELELTPFFEKGHEHLRSLYRDIHIPMHNVQRLYYPRYGSEPFMRESFTVSHLRSYFKTSSAYKTYCAKFPLANDIVDTSINEMLKEGQLPENQLFDVTWESVIILGHMR